MILRDILWKDSVLEKIESKHAVAPEEVEQVLQRKHLLRFVQKGHIRGEDMYAALGRTEAGRYLIVFLILKEDHVAMPITARDMDRKERKLYARQKKGR